MSKPCLKCNKLTPTHGPLCAECLNPREIKVEADQGQVGGTHYKELAVQPWHVMESVLTPEEFRGFLKGNIIKYAMRQGKKQDSDDANKCIHYQQKLGEILNQPTESKS